MNKLSEEIIKNIEKFILSTYKCGKIIDNENLNLELYLNFLSVNISIVNIIKNVDFKVILSFENKKEELIDRNNLLNLWTFLGSCLESTLQIFLSVYKNDYDNKPILNNRNSIIDIEDAKFYKLIEYFKENILQNYLDFESKIDFIRKNRNSIHLFNKKELDLYNELKESLVFYNELLEELVKRLPPLDDYSEYLLPEEILINEYIDEFKNIIKEQ